MGVSIHWYTLAVVTSLLNGCTLGYIGWRESDRALGQWSVAWVAWALAAFSLALLGSPEAHPFLGILCGCLWVVSSLLFLRGAYQLVGRTAPRQWYLVGGAAAALALTLGVGPHGALGMLPLVLFQSLGLVATGVVLIQNARTSAGAWLCGGALIVLGLHLLDAPLLAKLPHLFLWGFLLAIGLQILTALGMLMLYYEQAQTHLFKAQRELEQTRRIEALGRIAGGIAHDFNNILTVMQGNVEMLRRSGADAPEHSTPLDAIEETIERAARLTAQLLAFGRRSVLKSEAVDVREVTARTLQMLRQVIPEPIQLLLDSEDRSFNVALDQALLEQIVLNLVTNARDAISGHGRIVVELKRTMGPRSELFLAVKDDGGGMDESALTRVFEPFYTSKDGGTGLGLASVQGAVAQLGGQIRVTSVKGRGTTFEVRLPWVEPQAVGGSSVPSREEDKLRTSVVASDAAVSQATVKIVTDGGHKADQAADGKTALSRKPKRPQGKGIQ